MWKCYLFTEKKCINKLEKKVYIQTAYNRRNRTIEYADDVFLSSQLVSRAEEIPFLLYLFWKEKKSACGEEKSA